MVASLTALRCNYVHNYFSKGAKHALNNAPGNIPGLDSSVQMTKHHGDTIFTVFYLLYTDIGLYVAVCLQICVN